MAAEFVGSVILWLIALAIVVVVAVYLLRWLYRRSTKETSFVRTGFGGEKVVIGRGAFVVPALQEITPVGMNVMRIEVSRRHLLERPVAPTPQRRFGRNRMMEEKTAAGKTLCVRVKAPPQAPPAKPQ